MFDDEFVYAVITDHIPMDEGERFDKILQVVDGKSALERAVRAAKDSRFEFGVDVVIVLSSNEAVLDAATELGCVARQAPGFFEPIPMLRTYFSEPDVMIDEGDSPWIVMVDAETAHVGEPRKLREYLEL